MTSFWLGFFFGVIATFCAVAIAVIYTGRKLS